MPEDALTVEELLLILKIGFLVLLYLFIWRIVRSASRDIRQPQESFVLPPDRTPGTHRGGPGRLVVVKSPTLRPGAGYELDSAPVTIGRGSQNTIELHGDGFASSRHALVSARPDGVWLEDQGSTNGTFVNGARVERARKLARGDVIRVGETDLRFEP